MIKLRCTERSGKSKERKIELEKMSYSRWIDSKFYTYWTVNKTVYDKGDEVFLVHHNLTTYRGLTYTECKEMLDDILKIKGKMNFVDNDEEAEELQGYMKKFIEDVDHHYLSEIRGGQ